MPRTDEHTLSTAKQAHLSEYGSYQLRCEELHALAEYYREKYQIEILVQNFLPDDYCKAAEYVDVGANCWSNLRKIQTALQEGQSVGYIHTYGYQPSDRCHVECFIITKAQIIKPVEWRMNPQLMDQRITSIELNQYSGAPTATTNIADFGSTALPQARQDIFACGSLGIAYLKQLLKYDAQQLRYLCLCIPYFAQHGEQGEKLQYLFIPSPQVLRYSESQLYNLTLQALVMEDANSSFPYKQTVVNYTPLAATLNKTIQRAKEKNWLDLQKEAEDLLAQLPEFCARWQEVYLSIEKKRSLMQRGKFNLGLAYTSRRFQKIAGAILERTRNPGLALLHAIQNKKESQLSKENLLGHFSEAIHELIIDKPAPIGYFLNQLYQRIESKEVYRLFFQSEVKFYWISHARDFASCVALLDITTGARQDFCDYIRKDPRSIPERLGHCKSQAMGNKIDLAQFFQWLNLLQIPEKEKLAFVQEHLSREELGQLLFDQDYLNSKRFPAFRNYFTDKSAIAELLEYCLDEIQYKAVQREFFPEILAIRKHRSRFFSVATVVDSDDDEQSPTQTKKLSWNSSHSDS